MEDLVEAEPARRGIGPLYGVDRPAEVVVLDRPDLLEVAYLATSPGAVVVTAGPLAEGRESGAAYVCRGFVCELPTTDAGRLREQLAAR